MSNEVIAAVREHAERFEKSLGEVKTGAADEVKALSGKLERALDEIAQKMEKAPDSHGYTGPDKPHKNPLAALGASAEVKAFIGDRSMKTANVPLAGSLL